MIISEYVDSLKSAPEDAALIYKTEVQMICKLPTAEERDEAFRLLLLQGMAEEQISSDNLAIDMLLTGTFTSQVSRRQNHTKAITNGQKGGRPGTVDRTKVIELKSRGLTQQQIANELDCHVNTVRNILRDARNSGNQQKPTITNNNYDNIGSCPAAAHDAPASNQNSGYNPDISDDPDDLPF